MEFKWYHYLINIALGGFFIAAGLNFLMVNLVEALKVHLPK